MSNRRLLMRGAVALTAAACTIPVAFAAPASAATAPATVVGAAPATVLAAGKPLPLGGTMTSPGGGFTLVMQSDGNLVEYLTSTRQAVWASGTVGRGDHLSMQGDGNLVLYTKDNKPLWASDTDNSAAAAFALTGDGRFGLTTATSIPVWTGAGANVTDPGNVVFSTLTARRGTQTFTTTVRPDGNLVESVVDTSTTDPRLNRDVWSSNINTTGASYAVAQSDGNLVIYNAARRPVWSSATNGNPGGRLAAQTDGNLVVYRADGRPVWASNSVVPTTLPTADPADGSLPVGQATYAPPSGAIYAAPGGNDTTGNGSAGAPYATAKRAMSGAAAGATIVLRAGTYHESLFVGNTNLTIQAYPGEAVWFDGTVPVTGWRQSGSTWIKDGWNATFDHSASFSTGSNAGGFINPNYPMAAWPDQVYVDGVQLQQVAANPVGSQFAVDYTAHTITIGINPSGHELRAADLSNAFSVGGRLRLLGLGVRRYATPLPQIGTIFFGGSVGGSLLENVVVDNSATQAVSMDTPNVRLNHVTISNSGMTGVHTNAATNGIIENSLVTGSNTERFNPAPASAAIKISRTDGMVIRNNTITGNLGVNGIWTDENVTHYAITNNLVADNGAQGGIIVELSGPGVIAGNTVRNAKYGITAMDSGDVVIQNNTVTGSAVWGIGGTQDNRWQPGRSTAGPSVQPSTLNPWLVRNIAVVNNRFDGQANNFQFYVLDKETNLPASGMNISFSGNAFLSSTNGGPIMVGWGGATNSTVTYLTSLDAVISTTGSPSPGVVLASGASTVSVDSTATPLNSTLAGWLNQPVGTRHIGAF